jgi:hypothetical protein
MQEFELNYLLGLTYERPSWKDQVRSTEDIHPGQFLIKVGKEPEHLILITSDPYESKSGNLLFKYTYLGREYNPKKGYILAGNCTDNGLLAYPKGLWNRDNRLIKTKFPDMPIFLLNKILPHLKEDYTARDW